MLSCLRRHVLLLFILFAWCHASHGDTHNSVTKSFSQTFSPTTPSLNDLRLLFTPDYCNPYGAASSSAIQPFNDPSVFLIICPSSTGVLLMRWNQTSSTMLTFPSLPYTPSTITQHPVTGDIYFTTAGIIYSFQWNQSTLPTFTPILHQHGYNRTVCPWISNILGLVFTPDGSQLYAGCCATNCDFSVPSFVSAINFMTQQTIAINTTWEQSQNPSPSAFQNITQLTYILHTNDLLIVSQQYGVAVYDTTEMQNLMMLALSSNSTPSVSAQPRVLLDNAACCTPLGVDIDREVGLLMAICDNVTSIWTLTSPTNITVDPYGGVIVYPQTPSQACGTPSLHYHRSKRTLYQSCGSGPDRVFALQNLATPQSVEFTSLVNVDTCSSSRFLLTDRTQPDVLFSMCAEGMMRMEGRALTSILSGPSCLESSSVFYHSPTDSTYITCNSPPMVMRVHNRQVDALVPRSECLSTVQLIPDETGTQLFLLCENGEFSGGGNQSFFNVSLALSQFDPTPPPTLLFTLTGILDICTVYRGIFYCFVDQMNLYTWNSSVPSLKPQPVDLPVLTFGNSLVGCGDWLFIYNFTVPSIAAWRLDRIGLEQPTIVYEVTPIPPNNFQSYAFSNLVCDKRRQIVSVAFGTPYQQVQLVRINVTQVNQNYAHADTTSEAASTYTFNTDPLVTVMKIDIDTSLNLVYLILQAGYTTTPEFMVVYHADVNRFVSSIQIAKLAAPTIGGFFVDSYTSQVVFTISDPSDPTYNQVLILSSGWRCTTGSSWYHGACFPCPLGQSRSVVLSTNQSTYSLPKCQLCASGSIANSTGTIECIQCPEGRFADSSVGQVCSLCIAGFYSNTSGSTSCSPCASGRFSNSSESSSCWPASPGSYVSVPGQSMQLLCPSGQFTNTSEATECQPCMAGRYAAFYGTTNCTLTPAGYYTNLMGQNTPLLCPSGRYANTSGVTLCSQCDVGRYTPFFGAHKCGEAYFGYYTDQVGLTAEQPCSPGRFSNATGLTRCYECEVGRYAAEYGLSNCTTADKGFYVDQLGQNSQQQCPSGRYNDREGSTICQACAPGTFASLPSSTICDECLLGQFSAAAASNCLTCSTDSYTPEKGADCLSCNDQAGLECTDGLASVAQGYWPYQISSEVLHQGRNMSIQIYQTTKCPPGYCDGATLQFIEPGNHTAQLCQFPRVNSPDNWLCADCEEGYIAWGSTCQPCDGANVGMLFGITILSIFLVYILLRMNPAASPLTILVFFIQIAALELGNVSHWIDWIQFANLGAHSFTKCLAPFTPVHQMIFTLLIPFLLSILLAFLCGFHKLLAKYVTPSALFAGIPSSSSASLHARRTCGQRFAAICRRFLSWWSLDYNLDQYLGAFNAILIFCYTPVVVTVVEALHCVNVGPGQSRLFNAPSISCTSFRYQSQLLPFVYVFLAVYVIGLPLFMLVFVWRKWHTVATILTEDAKEKIKEEQLLIQQQWQLQNDQMQMQIQQQQQQHHRVMSDSASPRPQSPYLRPSSPFQRSSSPFPSAYSNLLSSSSIQINTNDLASPSNIVSYIPSRSRTQAAVSSSAAANSNTRPGASASSAAQLHPSFSFAFIQFNHRWGHYFRRYRLSAWYWQPIEMLQRFAFALTSVILIEETNARYAMYSTISAVSLAMHLWSHPFASDRMNQIGSICYFLLGFVSFVLTGQRPPYTLEIQFLFFLLIVPFSIVLFVWGIRLNFLGLKKYIATKAPGEPMSPTFVPTVPMNTAVTAAAVLRERYPLAVSSSSLGGVSSAPRSMHMMSHMSLAEPLLSSGSDDSIGDETLGSSKE